MYVSKTNWGLSDPQISNILTGWSDREPALTGTIKTRFKQGDMEGSVKLIYKTPVVL